MTAGERVRSTRRILGVGAIMQSVAWGVAVTLAILALFSFATLVKPDFASNSAWQLPAAIVAGVMVLGCFLWRSRHVGSVSRVALWIEERIPDLHYALVTAVESDSTRDPKGVERAVAAKSFAHVIQRALVRSVGPAAGAVAFAALLLYVSPSMAFGVGGVFGRGGRDGGGATPPAGSRLESLEARVSPPAYSRERSTVVSDPSSLSGLVGSRITIRGKGSADGVTGLVATSPLRVSSLNGGWSTSLVMPAKPSALTFKDREFERIIVLQPRVDNPPRIVLTSPARDSTLRVARLVLRMDATATDDIGLGAGYFEYLITTGSGEIFSARTVTTPVVDFNAARRGSIAATLDLGTLKLNQGDIVSIRAIAQDVNTLSGPGLATSDTRTYRIARADEYDSVSVDAAGPLPIDSSAMSQRMLIQMTEKLVREQKGLTRQQLVKRSTDIGDLEDRIRKRVHEILYEQDGGAEAEEPQPGAPPDNIDTHDHSDEPVPAHNNDLLQAYNALWEAVRSLQIAEPAPALPPMRVALKALDRARLANRLYLRGIPPRVIVDLARVRMTGKEKGLANTRTPISSADSTRMRLERGFSNAIELIAARPADAIRALTFLQVEALSSSPGFASAVGEAVEAFRKGRDATFPLLRARRALSGDPSSAPGLPSWSGGW